LTVDLDRAGGPPAVLVVEHEPDIGVQLVDQLAADGYRARLARTAEHARVVARTHPPAVALLGELELPRAALELLVEIRGGSPTRRGVERTRGGGSPTRGGVVCTWPADLPVIVIGTQAQELDLLRAFDAGADDFLARPARYLELRARLRALLYRAGDGRDSQRVEVGPLEIDVHAHAVGLHGRPLRLCRLEYELLLHLAREPQRVFAKQELLRAVWGQPTPAGTRTLDSHASRLRRKLRASGDQRWVINVRGVGYRLI
jgi:DNA-binding response OmpR family regulator